MEEANKPQRKSYDWLKQYQFQKGNNANPNGRPKGQSLKEFARIFLMSLPDEDKLDYLSTMPEDFVWKMAEGAPQTNTDITTGGKPIPIFGNVPTDNGHKEDTGAN